jgi:hypothetical protein
MTTTGGGFILLVEGSLGYNRLGMNVISTAMTCVTGLAKHFEQALPNALSSHLDKTQRRYLSHLVLRAIASQTFDQASKNKIAITLKHHIDEVDDDDSADVTQS